MDFDFHTMYIKIIINLLIKKEFVCYQYSTEADICKKINVVNLSKNQMFYSLVLYSIGGTKLRDFCQETILNILR